MEMTFQLLRVGLEGLHEVCPLRAVGSNSCFIGLLWIPARFNLHLYAEQTQVYTPGKLSTVIVLKELKYSSELNRANLST